MLASIDGCKAGWLIAQSESWPIANVLWTIAKDFASVLRVVDNSKIVVIDIPIGLSNEPRQCDRLAKKELGAYGSRVFFAPPRPALRAQDPREFQKIYKSIRGIGAGLPVWGITDKIREVDESMTPALQKRIYEFHPELAWKHLAKRSLDSKHGEAGLNQRRDILKGLNHSDLKEWKNRAGRAISIDDIFDALVGIAVAHGIAQGPELKRRISEKPIFDDRGLRMEIWF